MSLADQVSKTNLKELEKLIEKTGEPAGLKSMPKKKMKAKLRSALLSGKMRLKSLGSLKCSKKGKCESEVTNISAEVALNRDDTRVERRKRAPSQESDDKCMIFLPCAIVVATILATFLFSRASFDLARKALI